MSTSIESRVAARQRSRRKRVRSRAACCAVIIGLSTSLVVTNINYKKDVRALQDSNNELSEMVADMRSRDLESYSQMRALEGRLAVYEAPIDFSAAEPTYYDIPLSKDVQAFTYNMCVDYGIEKHYTLILAMMWQESHFTPDLVSSTNDYGIMQINECNHEWLRENLGVVNFLDERQSIYCGVHILSSLLHKYEDENKALMAYNMGERGAKNYWETGIYTSAYSRGVVAKREAIEANNYRAN